MGGSTNISCSSRQVSCSRRILCSFHFHFHNNFCYYLTPGTVSHIHFHTHLRVVSNTGYRKTRRWYKWYPEQVIVLPTLLTLPPIPAPMNFAEASSRIRQRGSYKPNFDSPEPSKVPKSISGAQRLNRHSKAHSPDSNSLHRGYQNGGNGQQATHAPTNFQGARERGLLRNR